MVRQIIHISDFHLESEPVSNKKVDLVKALIEDLKGQCIDTSKCIIAISGDLIVMHSKLSTLLYKGLASNAYAPEILVSYALVAPFGSKLCKKYDFERKISQAAQNAKIVFPDFRRILHNIISLSVVRDMPLGTTLARRSTYEVARIIMDSPDSVSLCEANEYDGVKWFNKERIEETMWYMLSSNVMCKQNLSRINIYKLYTVLEAAKDGAEYRIENFLSEVRPVGKAEMKELAKKASAKKTVKAEEKSEKPKAKRTRKTAAKKQPSDSSKE